MTADDRLLRRAPRLVSTVRFRVTALATLTVVGVLAAAGLASWSPRSDCSGEPR